MKNQVNQKLYYNLSVNFARFILESSLKKGEQNFLDDLTVYLELVLNQKGFIHLEIISKSCLIQGNL